MAVRVKDLEKVWPLYGNSVFTQLGGHHPVGTTIVPDVGVSQPATSITAPGSATGMRFLTSPDSIEVAEGLSVTDIAVSVVTATQATASVTLSSQAAEPHTADSLIATLTLQSSMQPTVVTVANCGAECGTDAADHFYVSVGTRGEGDYAANETPVRLYGKTDDSNFITADAVTFLLVAL